MTSLSNAFLITLPSGFEWLALVAAIGLFYIWIKSFIHLFRTAISDNQKIFWFLIIFFLGIVGSAIYYVAKPYRQVNFY